MHEGQNLLNALDPGASVLDAGGKMGPLTLMTDGEKTVGKQAAETLIDEDVELQLLLEDLNSQSNLTRNLTFK